MASKRKAAELPLTDRPRACWTCGGAGAPYRNGRPTYHTLCPTDPWINCTVCCIARKRTVPGEKHFTCDHHPQGAPRD